MKKLSSMNLGSILHGKNALTTNVTPRGLGGVGVNLEELPEVQLVTMDSLDEPRFLKYGSVVEGIDERLGPQQLPLESFNRGTIKHNIYSQSLVLSPNALGSGGGKSNQQNF